MPAIRQTAPATPSLSSSLTIRHVAAAADAIRCWFACDGPIVFAIPEDAEVDLAFVQLLLSARTKARIEGRMFRLQSPASGSLLSTLERAGLLNDAVEDDVAFWLHRKDPK